jgi:hypothetical protein
LQTFIKKLILIKNVVMKKNYNKALLVYFVSLLFQGSVFTKEFLSERSIDVMDSSSWIFPIRNLADDGSMIAQISTKSTATPLFYPKIVPLFEFLDKGDPSFYTLEQLSKNPRLAPRPNFHPITKEHSVATFNPIADKKVVNLENRLRELEEKLLEVQTKQVHRPNDEELKAFILDGNEHLSSKQRIDYLSRVISEAKQKQDPTSAIFIQQAAFKVPGISSVENNSLNPDFLSIPLPPTLEESDMRSPRQSYNPRLAKSSLRFKASVPTPQGTERPAQASEFYLTTRNLQDLLSDLNLDSALAGEVRSVAELWADAEKGSTTNPEIALGVKSILLQAKVGKARTDSLGKAQLDDVSPDDKYFLIGIDNDDQTGVITIWSKHVEVGPGENMVELTANDVIYHK